MEKAAKVIVDKTTLEINYPLDFLIIGPKEDNQLGILLQGSSEDRDYFTFDKNVVLSDLQRRVNEWNKLGSGKKDIGQHILDQYTGHVLDMPKFSLTKDAIGVTTTVKSGQPLSINAEAYDNYYYVWQGNVSASDQNKIQKEFTQHLPDIVKSVEHDNENQLRQYLDPIVTMSIAATKAFEIRTRQIRIARVIFISVAIVAFLAYLSFK